MAGKSPPSHLNLEDWLHTSPPADIYVLGWVFGFLDSDCDPASLVNNIPCAVVEYLMTSLIYFTIRFQEIVPLNAGNVLGTEDNGPAKKWLALIRNTLNSLPGTNDGCRTPSPTPDPLVELDADFEGSTQISSSFFSRRSFQSLSRSMRMMGNDVSMSQPRLDRRFSVCDRDMFGVKSSNYETNVGWNCSSEEESGDSPCSIHYSPMSYSGSVSMDDGDRQPGNSRYCLVSSKQMVGIFLTVWVKSDLRDYVRNMKVSCVGRGLMGYLGNKVNFIFFNMDLEDKVVQYLIT